MECLCRLFRGHHKDQWKWSRQPSGWVTQVGTSQGDAEELSPTSLNVSYHLEEAYGPAPAASGSDGITRLGPSRHAGARTLTTQVSPAVLNSLRHMIDQHRYVRPH